MAVRKQVCQDYSFSKILQITKRDTEMSSAFKMRHKANIFSPRGVEDAVDWNSSLWGHETGNKEEGLRVAG